MSRYLQIFIFLTLLSIYSFEAVSQKSDNKSTTDSSPMEPTIKLGAKGCGCKNKGTKVILVNNHPLKGVNVDINHDRLYQGRTRTVDHLFVERGKELEIGCNLHYCTSLAPRGYTEEFTIKHFTFVQGRLP